MKESSIHGLSFATMKLWLVERDKCDYDEYDAFVIRAATRAEAGRLAEESEKAFKDRKNQKVKITELSPEGKVGVILGSFNAG